jgi:rod shape-determining protein MreD
MKIIFFLILTIGTAFIFDTLLASFGGSIISPLVITVVCYWFWRLRLIERFFLALGMGLLLDVTGFLPIGTHMLILILMAYVCEPMKDFFSNNESRAVIALNVVILMIIFRLLMPSASLLNTFAASFV